MRIACLQTLVVSVYNDRSLREATVIQREDNGNLRGVHDETTYELGKVKRGG